MRWRSSWRIGWRGSCFFGAWASAGAAQAMTTRSTSRAFMGRHGTEITGSGCNNWYLRAMAELKTRILVVDDDQRLRDLLVRYLGNGGFEVKAVADAAAMDKQLARERYDLVVLDLMLPGEDGLAICRRLRGQEA